MIKNIQYFFNSSLSIKLTKICKKVGVKLCKFTEMTSLTSNSKLYNFVKNDQNATNLCRRLFLYKINKNIKNRGEILATDPL